MTSSATGQSARASLPPTSRSRLDTDSGQDAGQEDASTPSQARPNERYEFFKVIQSYLDKAARVLGMPEYIETHPEPAEERDHRQLPGEDGQRRDPALQGLPHPAQQPPRALQGRHALPREPSRSTT